MLKAVAKPFFGHGLGKFGPARWVLNLFLAILGMFKIKGTIEGCKLYLDSKTALNLATFADKKRPDLEIIKKYVRPGNIVIDLGANIGLHTIVAAKQAGGSGRVYAFEPDPRNFNSLKRNVSLNGLLNIIVERLGVSNINGERDFYLDKQDFTMHSLHNPPGAKRQQIKIKLVRLDDYFKNDSRIDFIKIDVEGAEYGAVSGMLSLLQKNKTVKLLTEFNPPSLQHAGTQPAAYLELLTKNGFKLYELDSLEHPVTSEDIKTLPDKYKDGYTNLLCMR